MVINSHPLYQLSYRGRQGLVYKPEFARSSCTWLPSQDSNLDAKLQRLLCYRYTTRQSSYLSIARAGSRSLAEPATCLSEACKGDAKVSRLPGKLACSSALSPRLKYRSGLALEMRPLAEGAGELSPHSPATSRTPAIELTRGRLGLRWSGLRAGDEDLLGCRGDGLEFLAGFAGDLPPVGGARQHEFA